MNMQHHSNLAGSRGFTLIELMIALVILAVVSSYAIASYQKSILKTNRAAAKTTLGKLSSAEENYHFSHNNYAATATTLIGAIPAQVSQKYTFSVTPAAPSTTYTWTATATGGQLKDTDCKTFSISSSGLQSATNSAGTANSSCW
jgi:type IV pilus assembly protein PilE